MRSSQRLGGASVFPCLMLALLWLATTPAEGARIVTDPIDNVAFQALIDAAAAGDTIVLKGGIYDFFTANAPVRITKRLRIEAADLSDPPIIEGDGTTSTPFATGNNGFVVFEQETDIVGLTIEGITFRDLDRAVAFAPALPGGPFVSCSTVASGRLQHATVRNCRFEDSWRGTQSFGGQVENLAIVDSVFVGVRTPVFLIGGAAGCLDAPGVFNMGRSTLTTVARNHMSGFGFTAIWADGVVKAAINHNSIHGEPFFNVYGILFGDSAANFLPDDGPIELGQAIGNEVSDVFACGIWGLGPTTIKSALIANNTLRDIVATAICLDSGANNMQVSNNEISGGVGREVLGDINLGDDTDPPWGFPPATYDNVVIVTDPDTLVEDGGIDNRILGTPHGGD